MTRVSPLLAGLLAATAAVAANAAAPVTELRLAPVADTSIYADINGFDRSWDERSDGQGESLWLSTTADGLLRRALVRFDLSAVPEGMQVVSATFTLYQSRSRSDHAVTMHRLLGSWGEGLSNGGSQGTGAQATAGDATWRWRDYGVTEWTTRGGDFVSAASASTFVGPPNQSYTWASTEGLRADVQGWLANPASNHGWILLGQEIDSPNAKRFDSGESPFATQRPLLVLQVTPIPEPGSALLLAAGVGVIGWRLRARARVPA